MKQLVRYLSYFIFPMILWTSCSGPQSPDFLQMKDVKLVYNLQNKLKMSGLAVYNNPNQVGGTLSRTDIKVIIDDVEVSHIQQNESIDIPANSDFTIPVNILIDPVKLNQENKGILGNILKQVLNNELEVQYKGNIYVSILNQEIGIPVNYSEKIKISLNYEPSE